MKTHKIFFLISLTFILSSCSSDISHQYFSEVGYIQTVITNVNDRTISLSNGMNLKTDRIIIAVNSTPVLLVIENYSGSGYFYLRNNRVNFSVASAGAFDIDMMGLNRGRLHYLDDFNQENQTITLVDSTQWFVPLEEQFQQVKNWKTTPELIIPYNKPKQGEYFIHAPSSQSVLAIPVDEINTRQNK